MKLAPKTRIVKASVKSKRQGRDRKKAAKPGANPREDQLLLPKAIELSNIDLDLIDLMLKVTANREFDLPRM